MESKNWSGLGISALISLLECRCHSGVTFWTGGGGPNPLADMDPPFADLDPRPYQTFLLSIVCIIFGN